MTMRSVSNAILLVLFLCTTYAVGRDNVVTEDKLPRLGHTLQVANTGRSTEIQPVSERIPSVSRCVDGGSASRHNCIVPHANPHDSFFAQATHRRRLTQASNPRIRRDAEAICGLRNREISAILDSEKRIWTITDDVLDDINNDLQAVVNCTRKDDVVLFDVSSTVRPKTRITIPWNLTVSGFTQNVALIDDIFPTVDSKTVITCPEENEGVFLITYLKHPSVFWTSRESLCCSSGRDFVLANIEVRDCALNGNKAHDGIVEVESCSSKRVRGSVMIHHVNFVQNELIKASAVRIQSPSCVSLGMNDARFEENQCIGNCYAVLARRNLLQGVLIADNKMSLDDDVTSSLVLAPYRSRTEAKNLTALNNQGAILHVEEGSLSVSDSIFSDNIGDLLNSGSSITGCIHLNASKAVVTDSRFEGNSGDIGGVLSAEASNVTLRSSIFTNNKASIGGVVYAREKTFLLMRECNFTSNEAEDDGGVVYMLDSTARGSNLNFALNSAGDEGGCFRAIEESRIEITDSRMDSNRADFGGSILIDFQSVGRLQRCRFENNTATTSGGTIYVEESIMTVDKCEFISGNASFGGDIRARAVSLNVTETSFAKSTARFGGALHLVTTTAELFAVSFESCSASDDGGAIRAILRSDLSASNCSFIENSASVSGGALSADSSTIKVQESPMIRNEAIVRGGAIAVRNQSSCDISQLRFVTSKAEFGGALYLTDADRCVVRNVIFLRNNANTFGGAIYVEKTKLFNVTQCQFENSNAEFSGFIHATSVMLLYLTDSVFRDGTATSSGGCMRIQDDSFADLKNVTMTECFSNGNGGAVFLFDSTLTLRLSNLTLNTAGGNGAAIYSSESNLRAGNVSMLNNTSGATGGGMYASGPGRIELETVAFENSFAAFGGAIGVETNLTGTVTDCVVRNNSAITSGGGSYVEESNISFTHCRFIDNVAMFGGCILVIQSSTVNLSQVVALRNSAESGGCVRVTSASFLHMENVEVKSCSASKEGGGLDVDGSSQANVTNSTFESNAAKERGGAIRAIEANVNIALCFFNSNGAVKDGGALYAEKFANISINDSEFVKNAGEFGGAIRMFGNSALNANNVTFSNNTATQTGGAFYEHSSDIRMIRCSFVGCLARFGGCGLLIESTAQISDSKFEHGSAIKAGGLLEAFRLSTLKLRNTSFSEGIAEVGGAIVVDDRSYLEAIDVQISNCNATRDGGAILANQSSTVLCAHCSIVDNRAVDRGGAVAFETTEVQSLAIQFDKSRIVNNFAESGGGISFVSTVFGVDCSKPNARCTFMALTATTISKNQATLAGGGIFTTDLKAIRLNCTSENKPPQTRLYTRSQLESMSKIASIRDICSNWEGNSAAIYGDTIGSYVSQARVTVFDQSDGTGSLVKGNAYQIHGQRSGSALPIVSVTVVDGLGQGPAIGLTNGTVTAYMTSPDNYFTGSVSTTLFGGTANFTRVVGFQRSGSYRIDLRFSEDSIQSFVIIVAIRPCVIGESLTADGTFCERCSQSTFSLQPESDLKCQPCPENGNCTTNVILPNKGYWHQSPCSHHIQRCLIKRACEYKSREDVLNKVTEKIENCSVKAELLSEYTAAQCKKGHQGPLCGSCEASFGKSQSFSCEQCFTGGANLVLVVLSILILIGLSSFAIRSNLSSRTSHEVTTRSTNTPVNTNASTSEQSVTQVNEKTMEMMRTRIAPEGAPSSDLQICHSTQPALTAREAELLKWKAVETFKITINNLQVTAVAISINVDWHLALLALYETAEFFGGVTSEATNRSVDCLIADDASVNRSVASTIIDTFVPITVIFLLAIFWSLVTFRYKETTFYLIKKTILSAIAVSYISYISITKTLVNILNCIDVHDSHDFADGQIVDHITSVWAVDTNLECYEGPHASLAGGLGWPFLIIFSFGFPVVIAFFIMKKVEMDYKRGWIYEISGFLYRAYKPKYLFWESIVMLRKAVLAVVVVFSYPLGGNLQAVLTVFVLAIALYAHTACRPYRHEFDFLNELESVSLLVSLLTFVSSLFYNDDRVSDRVLTFISVAIAISNIGLFFSFMYLFSIFGAE